MNKKDFSMNEEFELRGYWYLPSEPDKKIAGILSYSTNGINLELFGSFKGDMFSKNDGNHEIVLGDSEQNITLLNGIQKQMNQSKYESSIYNFKKVIIGGHFYQTDDIKFDSLSVNFTNIEEWLGCHPFISDQELDVEKKEIKNLNASYYFPPISSINIPSIQANIKLSFMNNTKEKRYHYLTMEQFGYFNIIPYKEESLNWYSKKINSIQNFLSLIFDFPTYPLKIHGYIEDVENESDYKKLTILLSPINGNDREVKTSHIFIRYSHIEDKLSEMLNIWFDIESTPYTKLYLSNFDNKSEISKFINYANALESFHRKTLFKNKLELRKRLNDLTYNIDKKNLSMILQEFRVESLSDLVVNNRNYYTHYNKIKRNILNKHGLYLLNVRIKTIMLYHLLKLLGVTNDEFHSSIYNYEKMNSVIRVKLLNNKNTVNNWYLFKESDT